MQATYRKVLLLENDPPAMKFKKNWKRLNKNCLKQPRGRDSVHTLNQKIQRQAIKSLLSTARFLGFDEDGDDNVIHSVTPDQPEDFTVLLFRT